MTYFSTCFRHASCSEPFIVGLCTPGVTLCSWHMRFTTVLMSSQAVEQLQPVQEPAKNVFTELFTGIKVC